MAAHLSRRALLRWGLAGVGAAALSACANSAGSSGASSTAASSASGTPMPTVGPPPAVGLLSSAEQAGALVEWIASGAAQAQDTVTDLERTLIDRAKQALERVGPLPLPGHPDWLQLADRLAA